MVQKETFRKPPEFLDKFERGNYMIKLKLQLCSETATAPTKAHPTDACFDLYADLGGKGHTVSIGPDSYATIPTGIKTEIPEGYFAPIFCRSGMGINKHLRLSNSVGIIDASYRGEWMVALHNDGACSKVITHEDRIAQFTLLPILDFEIEETTSLEASDRGEGGFGSTGN